MRERFTADEWSLVSHIPFDAFLFAAVADKDIDQAEFAAFMSTLQRADQIADPLHREIAQFWAGGPADDIGSELKFQLRESSTELEARIARTRLFLNQKLNSEEYQAFMLSVTMSSMAVAAASSSKKGLFGKKKPISEQEAHAVTAFAVAWGVNPLLLQQRLAGVR